MLGACRTAVKFIEAEAPHAMRLIEDSAISRFVASIAKEQPNTATLYRAMSQAEMDITLASLRPNYLSRFKWFSDEPDFILRRVMDGKFNNSAQRPDRYATMLAFQIPETQLQALSRVSKHELMLDVRKAHTLDWLSIKEIGRRV